MYILNQTGTQIYNSDFFDHFLVSSEGNLKTLIASKGRDDRSAFYVMGRYCTTEEAKGVLLNLLDALCANESRFEMPLSEAVAPEPVIYDKRTKRRGGS